MAKLIVVTRNAGDRERGDVTAVYNDEEDEGRSVREIDLFRVVRAPGNKSLYQHLTERDPPIVDAPGGPVKVDTPFRKRSVDLDSLEASERLRSAKGSLAATDEVVLSVRAALTAAESIKAV